METLRRAMLHTEGPVKGSITLTIARRANSPANINQSEKNSSQNNSGTMKIVFVETFLILDLNVGPELNPSLSTESENSTTDNSGASESSGNTVIFLPYKNSEHNSIGNNILSPIPKGMNPNWNPVIDRITGQSKNQMQLRNESYYMVS